MPSVIVRAKAVNTRTGSFLFWYPLAQVISFILYRSIHTGQTSFPDKYDEAGYAELLASGVGWEEVDVETAEKLQGSDLGMLCRHLEGAFDWPTGAQRAPRELPAGCSGDRCRDCGVCSRDDDTA
ncbi:MAG: hypothetical protein WC516_00735 [Patescibacteria group bacterium]